MLNKYIVYFISSYWWIFAFPFQSKINYGDDEVHLFCIWTDSEITLKIGDDKQ